MSRTFFLFFSLLFSSLLTYSTAEAAFGSVNPSTTDLPPLEVSAQAQLDPLKQLDNLIAATEKSLAEQKTLRSQLSDYQQLNEQYMQNRQDRQLGIRLVKAARSVLHGIESHQLIHTFDQETLEELRFFSKIGSKKGLPRPR